jgi:hypothetical protein
MERARLRDLMRSEIPKADSYLPVNQFDKLFETLNPKEREVWTVGGSICAIIYRLQDSLVRIYRGNPKGWPVLQSRIALGEMEIESIADSPLGSGVLASAMARELTADSAVVGSEDYGPPEKPAFVASQAAILRAKARDEHKRRVDEQFRKELLAPKKKKAAKKRKRKAKSI